MSHKIRKYLLAPFIYTAAILLLFEEWLWNASKRLFARLPLIPFIARLESWIGNFSPYAALAIFLLPSLLLLPVKILALLSIAHGHPTLGLVIIITAKVFGTRAGCTLVRIDTKSITDPAMVCSMPRCRIEIQRQDDCPAARYAGMATSRSRHGGLHRDAAQLVDRLQGALV